VGSSEARLGEKRTNAGTGRTLGAVKYRKDALLKDAVKKGTKSLQAHGILG